MVKLEIKDIDRKFFEEGLKEKSLQAMEIVNRISVPKFVCGKFTIETKEDGIYVKNTTLVMTGDAIKTHLKNCETIYVLCATLGREIDDKISTYQRIDMSKGYLINCFSDILIEKLCEQIESEIEQKEKKKTTSRFSCGYADLDLNLQSEFLKCVNAEKVLGIKLTDGNLMKPYKTVTAVIGLGDDCFKGYYSKCDNCGRRDFCDGKKCFN